MMKKLFLCLAALFCSCAISAQAQKREDSGKQVNTEKRDEAVRQRDDANRDAPHGLAFCGTTIDRVWEINQQARRALSSLPKKKAEVRDTQGRPTPIIALPKPASVFTPQPSFPVAKVITCGKFRLYYEDLLQSNNDGFAHPTLGAARRNTLCAVLGYVQSVVSFNQLPANEYIDLYVMHSYAPTNPAPVGTGFLAIGGPFYNSNYGMPGFAGFYGGHMFDHLTSASGADPEPGQYDGVLQVNFDKIYPGGQNISYWDDYTNTASACKWDLYTVLLHEVTHAMGWLSAVKEDATTNHYAQNTQNNSFTLLDKYFLYYGEAHTPSTFTGTKLVTVSAAPSVNAAVNANPNPLRSSKVWMNRFGIPLNHPAYSGDFNGYYSTPPAPNAPGSLLSHMNDGFNSFTRMSQYSPGFQPNYVMGYALTTEQFKRQWTNFEMRSLLTIGYQLDPAFASSTGLSGGSVTNQNLLTVNQPPYRLIPTQVTEYAQWGPAARAWAETMPVTATIPVNNNLTMPSTASQAFINVSNLGGDANGDTVRVLPNSLFNIRGCGSTASGLGGDNHDRLSVNTAGTQVTFTPRPGFGGRAQFGFYLWDGKEKGSFVVATINVLSANLSFLPPIHNKIMNGDFELGTEVRQRMINESIEHTGVEFYREGPFMSGSHLSDNQPSYNIYSNYVVVNPGEYVYQSWKECSQINGGLKGNYGFPFSDFNSNGYTAGTMPVNPLGNSATTPNQRYHAFAFDSFFELITPVTQCNYYRFEMDINFERTSMVPGNNFSATLKFITNPGTTASATTLNSVPLTIPVTTVAHNAWQHFSVDFPYCPTTSATFIDIAPVGTIYPYPLIDNLSLLEIMPKPPLTVSATATPSAGACPTCATLSATATNTSCATTYTWQPGNLSGPNVTVCPPALTTYTLTVDDGCRTATATVTVAPGVGTTSWAKHPPGNSREAFTATARASNDDLIAAGYFTRNVTIPGFPTWTVPDESQVMIARFSENCGTIWAKQLGSAADSEGVGDMVIDSAGNIFITGSIGTGTTTFGSFTLIGPAVYILKLDGANGNVLAAKASSVSNTIQSTSLTIDAADNVYVAGQYAGSLNFGTSAMTSMASSSDVFVVKYSNLLVPQWSTSFGSPAYDDNGGIAWTSTGSLYVASNMYQTFSIGSSTFANATPNTSDMFIGRFNPTTGAFISGRMEGNSTDSCIVRDIAVDGSGNVYFTGSFKGTFNVTGFALNAPTTDIFIGRWLSSTLANSWAYSMGGSDDDEGRSISFDGAGNVYFAGNFIGTATFTGFTPSLLTGGRNIFVVKVAQVTGVRSFAAQSTSGAPSVTINYSITTLPGGQSYVAGYFMGTTTFGSSATQTAAVSMDAIIGRLSNTGSFY